MSATAVSAHEVTVPGADATEPDLGPPVIPGRGPASSAWREEAITRANELEGLAAWVEVHRDPKEPQATGLLASLREHLSAVRRTAAKEDANPDGSRPKPWTRWWSSLGGGPHERALGNLDAVEATLLRLAPAPTCAARCRASRRTSTGSSRRPTRGARGSISWPRRPRRRS